MAWLAFNFVLFLTLAMYLSIGDGTTFVKFEKTASFSGTVIQATQTIDAAGCSVACSNQPSSCRAGRFNAASTRCQLLGYAMDQMNETFLSPGDWSIFVKVFKKNQIAKSVRMHILKYEQLLIF